ncbi:MAG: outer membrane protein transport protein [Melioribacteraceae bacterium]|nr:outer membrane protein transport protein [Melioribacteraceae bacterium]
MKKKIVLFTILSVLFALQPLLANGLSLNSIGTRALGMGGAFVGLANDGSAIYWNPAGLVGQKSVINLSLTDIMPSASYKFDLFGIDAASESQMHLAPNLFVNYNMGDLALGFGVFVPAGLGVSWDPQDLGVPAPGLEMLSQIGVINIAPAIAYKVSDQFSVGLTVNIYYAMFDMKQPVEADLSAVGGPTLLEQFEEESTGLGFGATIGLKYQASEQFSIGAVVRLATTVSMEGTAKNPIFPKLPNFPPVVMAGPGESDFSRDVTWPLWLAGGIAYKASDNLTLTLDAQYSQWSELDALATEYDDAYWKAAIPEEESTLELQWEDAVQIRAGAEYVVNNDFTLRLGYYYDPAPAPDETLNILFPSSTNHVATAGFGYSFGSMKIEGGLEYLFGAERDVELNAENAMPGIHQMDIFAFSVAFGVEL